MTIASVAPETSRVSRDVLLNHNEDSATKNVCRECQLDCTFITARHSPPCPTSDRHWITTRQHNGMKVVVESLTMVESTVLRAFLDQASGACDGGGALPLLRPCPEPWCDIAWM
jgi:hypothetical protein